MYVDTWIICTVIRESVSYQTCHRLIDYLLLFSPPFKVVKSSWIINNSFLFWCGVSLSNSTCCLYFDLTYRLIKMQHNLLKNNTWQINTLKTKCLFFFIKITIYQKSSNGKTAFIKIHAPWKVLIQGAEEMLMKMPIRV